MGVLRGLGRRASWLGAVVVWAAASSCGTTPPAPARAPAPEATATAAPAEDVEPALSLVGREPSLEPAVELRDEPLPAFDGRFERVRLPTNMAAVVAVVGRGGDDVWMLAKGNAVLHFDGKRTTQRGNPRCRADSCCGRLIDCAPNREVCSPTCSLGDRQEGPVPLGWPHAQPGRGAPRCCRRLARRRGRAVAGGRRPQHHGGPR